MGVAGKQARALHPPVYASKQAACSRDRTRAATLNKNLRTVPLKNPVSSAAHLSASVHLSERKSNQQEI